MTGARVETAVVLHVWNFYKTIAARRVKHFHFCFEFPCQVAQHFRRRLHAAFDEVGSVFITPSILIGNMPDIRIVFCAAYGYKLHKTFKRHLFQTTEGKQKRQREIFRWRPTTQ